MAPENETIVQDEQNQQSESASESLSSLQKYMAMQSEAKKYKENCNYSA